MNKFLILKLIITFMGCSSSCASSNDDVHSINKQLKNNKTQLQLSEREEDLNDNIKNNKKKNNSKLNTNNNSNSNNNINNDKEHSIINEKNHPKVAKRNRRHNNVGTYIFHSDIKSNLSKKEENDLNELDNLLLEDDNNNNNENGINNENNESNNNEEESNEEEEQEEEENDFGVLIDENIKEIYQSDLLEDDIIAMVSNAVSHSIINRNNGKSLNEKQITVIGTIIHDVLFSRHTFDLSRPIKHKSLKNVLVKVSIRKLSTQLIKETYFRGKKVTKKQLKKALKEIIGDSTLRDIRVLRIEIF